MTAQPHSTAMPQPPLTSSATARQLDAAAPWRPSEHSPAGEQSASQRRRTPLSVVPAPLPKTGRGFVALCALMLIAALGVVLSVNITVSNRQYDLVTLRAEHTDLTQANERLTQQAEHLAAPQNLAAKAAGLGMVMPGDVAAIDVKTGAVTGTATAAQEDDKPTGFVAAPSVPQGGSDAAGEDSARASSEEAAPGADAAASDSTGEDDAAEQAAAEEAADPEPEFSEDELNGGSIPAPQIQAPTR